MADYPLFWSLLWLETVKYSNQNEILCQQGEIQARWEQISLPPEGNLTYQWYRNDW